MTPNSSTVVERQNAEERVEEKAEYKTQIVWLNVFIFASIHLAFLYGLYLAFTSENLKTTIFGYVYGTFGGIGITGGSHRLWSHRSYKARWPLRALLCIFTSIAAQNDIYEWSRDHRVHHKFTETNADPHNIKRGFFFAHVGWLMCKKHPDVLNKGKTVYLDDLCEDPIVRFHKRFYFPMVLIFGVIIPIIIPMWFWGETLWNSFFIAVMTRYALGLNFTWLVNSAAHYSGNRPFDKYIEARENWLVSLVAKGEGWHNYHHVFPWDYATSELGYTLNITKIFIDLMACIGLAYDLKTAHPQSVKNRKLKSGDGTRSKFIEMTEEDFMSMSKTS